MRQRMITPSVAVVLAAMLFVFSSCIKDDCRRTYKIFTPVYKTLTNLRAEVQNKPAASVANTGKLYIRGSWIFLNELNKGIHVIDNSNPSHPVKVSFINIPGNVDMYTKGNILYADLYCDLMAADITDPRQISVTKYLTNTFPDRSAYSTSTNPDSIKILVAWPSRDTSVSCDLNPSILNCPGCGIFYNDMMMAQSASSGSKAAGTAGSMARFAAVNNYMYAVTTRDLNVIDITNAANPLFVKKKTIGSDIETIFPYNNKLFIGAGSSMSVYGLDDPANPLQMSWNGHWCSRDPVVADDKYAYVTLHEANGCNSLINQLEIYSLSTANTPVLIKEYPMKHPMGLSKEGDLLFLCDDGLKVYDVQNPGDIKLVKHFPGINTYDVIATGGIAYVVTKDGLYQYDYSNPQNIRLISKLLK